VPLDPSFYAALLVETLPNNPPQEMRRLFVVAGSLK
jgi:hypothetical protein